MKVQNSLSLLLVFIFIVSSPCLGAKLDAISNLLRGYNYDAPEAPAKPSGLYELPGPPPAPVIPTKKPTTTTTTTNAPPPPPLDLYGPPDYSLTGDSANNANRFANFVTPKKPLPTPEIPKVQFKESSRVTPRGFKVPEPVKVMNMPYMPYEINYGVHDTDSGNVYSHSEISEGNNVQGEYRVLLPDGRTQVVSFYADPDTGYKAEVTYV